MDSGASRPLALARALAAGSMLFSIPGIAAAQAAPEDAVCYGFSFGRWTPALDQAAAGHDAGGPAAPRTPEGRGWATSDSSSGAALILFPTWWPAGVRVTLPSGPPPLGKSASGTASALVADGRRRAPTAPILVRGVACAGDAARRRPLTGVPG